MEDDLKKIDALVKAAKVKEARRLISQYREAKIPRAYVLRLARLARATGLSEIAIRHLNPIVRPPAKSTVVATDLEKAVYAAVLTRIGAATEALEILQKVDKEKVPECLLYETYALVSRWNYKDTIPLLKKYVALTKLDAYSLCVGQVNLAAAYVHERKIREASTLLAVLRDKTREENLTQLYGNTLELSAQHAIFDGKWSEAGLFLSEAEKVLQESDGLDAFFVKKWRAISEMLKNPKRVEAVRKVRQSAILLKHWETVRDCDRFECIATRNEELYRHLYFGTPYADFRERLKKDFEKEPSLPEFYIWNMNGSASGNKNVTDGKSGGQLLHRLFKILTSDFYRPTRLAAIYSSLYPGEYFNPRSSPDRVHQAMKRLRIKLRDSRAGISIKEEDTTYSLVSSGSAGIKVYLEDPPTSHADARLAELKKLWPKDPFTVNDVIHALGISSRSGARLLLLGVNRGVLLREGKASLTTYRF